MTGWSFRLCRLYELLLTADIEKLHPAQNKHILWPITTKSNSLGCSEARHITSALFTTTSGTKHGFVIEGLHNMLGTHASRRNASLSHGAMLEGCGAEGCQHRVSNVASMKKKQLSVSLENFSSEPQFKLNLISSRCRTPCLLPAVAEQQLFIALFRTDVILAGFSGLCPE